MANKLLQQLLGFDEDLPSVSPKELIVLRLLARGKELYGLEIVKESEGAISKGTVYVTLGRMQDKGYIESRQEEPPTGATGLPRRLYHVTGDGERVLRFWELAGSALRHGATS